MDGGSDVDVDTFEVMDVEQVSIQKLLDDTDKFLSNNSTTTVPMSLPDKSSSVDHDDDADDRVDQILRDTNSLLMDMDRMRVTLPDADDSDALISQSDVRQSRSSIKEDAEATTDEEKDTRAVMADVDAMLAKMDRLYGKESVLNKDEDCGDDDNDDAMTKATGLEFTDEDDMNTLAAVDLDNDTSELAERNEGVGVRELNRQLVRAGFSPVGLLGTAEDQAPTKKELMESLEQVLRQYEQQSSLVNGFMSEQAQPQSRPRSMTNDDGTDCEFLESANKSLQSRLRDAEETIRRLKQEKDESERSLSKTTRDLENRVSKLRMKSNQAEHQLRARDNSICKMQEKLQAVARADEKRREKDAKLFERMFNRSMRPSSAKDSSIMEMISAFETQRVQMQGEIDRLKKMLKDSAMVDADKDHRKTSVYEQELASAFGTKENTVPSQNLLHMQNEFERDRRRYERDIAHAREMLKATKEERDHIRRQLESRPSLSQYKDLKAQVSKLNSQLIEARNVSDLRRQLGTSELIRRDKDVHRLGLDRLEHLPQTIAKEILQEICRELDIDDVSLALPALRKIVSVVRVVPQLQEFVREIVAVVHPKEGRYEQDEVERSAALVERVIPTLKVWREDIRRLDDLEDFRIQLSSLLRKRAHVCQSVSGRGESAELAPTSTMDILGAVKELVETERHLFDSKEAFDAVDQLVKDRPDVVVHKIISHFCHLFDCASIEAVFPTMNRIYLTIEEQRNFIKCVRSTLRLGEDSSLNSCLSALQKVGNDTSELALRGDARDSAIQDALQRLKQYLECETPDEVVQTCRKLKDRCALYDGMFPRVDRVLKSLFGLLGVDHIDQIVPSVRRLILLDSAAPKV